MANTAALLENNLTTKTRCLSPFQSFWKEKAKCSNLLQKFVEICTMTHHNNTTKQSCLIMEQQEVEWDMQIDIPSLTSEY